MAHESSRCLRLTALHAAVTSWGLATASVQFLLSTRVDASRLKQLTCRQQRRDTWLESAGSRLTMTLHRARHPRASAGSRLCDHLFHQIIGFRAGAWRRISSFTLFSTATSPVLVYTSLDLPQPSPSSVIVYRRAFVSSPRERPSPAPVVNSTSISSTVVPSSSSSSSFFAAGLPSFGEVVPWL